MISCCYPLSQLVHEKCAEGKAKCYKFGVLRTNSSASLRFARMKHFSTLDSFWNFDICFGVVFPHRHQTPDWHTVPHCPPTIILITQQARQWLTILMTTPKHQNSFGQWYWIPKGHLFWPKKSWITVDYTWHIFFLVRRFLVRAKFNMHSPKAGDAHLPLSPAAFLLQVIHLMHKSLGNNSQFLSQCWNNGKIHVRR